MYQVTCTKQFEDEMGALLHQEPLAFSIPSFILLFSSISMPIFVVC